MIAVLLFTVAPVYRHYIIHGGLVLKFIPVLHSTQMHLIRTRTEAWQSNYNFPISLFLLLLFQSFLWTGPENVCLCSYDAPGPVIMDRTNCKKYYYLLTWPVITISAIYPTLLGSMDGQRKLLICNIGTKQNYERLTIIGH